MANALEAASLVMIPSGYSDGTLGSLKPIDGSGDFTFTRGTDIGATRVAEDGYIEKGYENLLLQSNSFNTTWASVRVSESTGFTGYDGTNDAWKIVPNTQVNDHRLDQNTSVSGVWTFTGYFKAAGYDFLYLLFSGLGNSGKIIDISPNQGVVVDSKGGTQAIDESITDVGNDWWKITLTYSGALGTLRIITLPANDTSAYAGDGTSGILIQDAQLNQGLVAMPYLPTTTTASVGGILANQPRIDFTGGGCGSLLLEPSRTNLVNFSEYYGQYNSTRSTITNNYGISPDGSLNAAAVFNTSENGRHNISGNYFSVTSGTSYVNSVFAKAGTITKIKLKLHSGGGTSIGFNDGDFDLTYGTATGTGAGIESYGNGWYRCYVVDSPTSSVSNARFNLELLDANGGVSYVGSVTDYIEVFGSQVEQGSYPTSLIPTYGTSVTRAADDALATPTIANTETLTFFTKFVAPERQSGGGEYLLNNSSGSSRIRIYQNTSDSLRIRTDLPAVNFNYSYSSLGISIGDKVKVCLRIENGVMTAFINGVDKNTFGAATINFAKLRLRPQTIMNVDSTIIFPTALSDAALIELTTL